MDWISNLWQDHCTGEHAFWRLSSFWLLAAAVVLPFGWALLAFRLQPVRVRSRHVLRHSYLRRDS